MISAGGPASCEAAGTPVAGEKKRERSPEVKGPTPATPSITSDLDPEGGTVDEQTPSWTRVTGSPAHIRQLDHTADVGVEVRAPTPCTLLAGGVAGMTELILGEGRPDPVEVRTVTVEGEEYRLLLRNLLREVLWLHEAEGFAVARVSVRVESGPERLTATAELRGGPDPAPPVRELKGVTLHGLEAREEDGEWFARVIFDV